MDIVIHTLSGIAVGTVIASKWKCNKAILMGALGGALPDFDAISLWSGFDQKIGSKLGLTHNGHDIYFGKYWYSHHAIMHSIFAILILSFVIYFIAKKCSSNHYFSYTFAFSLSYLLHLFEDMPTPGSVWGGVNLFWPYKDYIGGSGDIWWWNNYDLFLIVLSIISINIILIFCSYFTTRINFSNLAFGVFAFGLLLGIYQIKNRNYDFNYKGFATNFDIMEEKSLAIQKEILGTKMYNIMVSLDNKIPLNF